MKNTSKRVVALLGAVALMASLAACGEQTHTHDYSKWESNKTYHWKVCTEDGEKDQDSQAKHTDENKDGKCDVCGYDVGLPHEHSYTAWDCDETNHWKVCPEDNEKDASSVEAHIDANADGKCDVCGQELEAPAEASVTIDVTGVPTLVVKGPITEKVGCVKLHGEANGAHLYWDNQSKLSNAYEFRVPLSELPLEGTPWVWFHIYVYEEANPADKSKCKESIDLDRGGEITVGQFLDYEGTRYTVIGNGDSTQLVIQPTKTPDMSVDSIYMQIIEGKPVLVVKGTMIADIGCIKLHANGNGDSNFFGDNVSKEAGKFELHMDLSQVPVDDTPWLWFHIYTYEEAEPADPKANFKKNDLARGTLMNVGDKLVCGDVVYTVLDQGQLVIQPKPASKLSIDSVIVDTTDKPTLVIKGNMPGGIGCLKLHAEANGTHLYADNSSTEAGKYELRFDLTQITADGTPWIWFHIYTYTDAAPADSSACIEKIDLPREDRFADDAHWDYNGIRYSIVTDGGAYGLIVIQPTKISE